MTFWAALGIVLGFVFFVVAIIAFGTVLGIAWAEIMIAIERKL